MSTIDYSPLYEQLREWSLQTWIPEIQRGVREHLFDSNNGHLSGWVEAVQSLPPFEATSVELKDEVRFRGNLDAAKARESLMRLHPWRKGPIHLDQLTINTEWRSDWKWDRLKEHIEPLENRIVLDIGCGNGYHLWRMAGMGARLALGIDPYLLFVMQFWAIRHFAPIDIPAWVLPLGWEDLPESLPVFDTVFSMGVLYHRRNPEKFLRQMRNYVKPGGEWVLETLVINGRAGDVLVPRGCYAKMRNVWYIPSVATLEQALREAGWKNVRCIDVTVTSQEEQRSTEWMTFESLKDYLDPRDPGLTVEGHPAPVRAVLVANKAV